MKTDSKLQQDVIAELRWHPALHAAQIGVAVLDGVVTLSGEVSSYGEKVHAEQAAQGVAGVQALAVEMTVKLSEFGRRTDADIASSALHALSWTDAVPPDAIQLVVDDGWITLSGEVEWQFQRQAAADSVRLLQGVKGLSNQVRVEPTLLASAVKADIEAAIRRRASSDANAIQVEVSGSEVTLSGSAKSWAERELAERAAWGSPGVRRVVDHIAIV